MANYNNTQTYITAQESQIHLYGGHQFSPANSMSPTPTNISPTSPRNTLDPNYPFATVQLRPPKSPMYVPAVLRPTERPPRPTPLTPPRSVHGSTESLEPQVKSSSRTSTSDGKRQDVGQVVEIEDASISDLSSVTGPPTRDHWKPDANATVCDAPVCQKYFSLFERRHHCRHCGHVFCNSHSHYTVPLDQDAEFHPSGTESRACKHCWNRYQEWQATRSRKNSVGSATTSITGTPIIGIGMGNRNDDGPNETQNSVPKDWNWSTF
ncbi:MAG: hypothetical protein MMC33_002870 [Icmadophila ericetorum]|nr:hypothetical protein [Icmadophila ericetorum]